jgi:hypothetical protein
LFNAQDGKLLLEFLRRNQTRLLPTHLKKLTVVQINDGTVQAGKAGGKAKKAALRGTSGDNSNTQFAILALWVARRHGIPMERTLTLIDHRFQSSQNADGGWGYQYLGNAGGTTPSMTCVGLLGLAVGHGLAQETAAAAHDLKGADAAKPRVEDSAIRRGLKKLSAFVGSPAPTGKVGWSSNLYFLWSLERIGVLYDLKTIGNKDSAEVLAGHVEKVSSGPLSGGPRSGSPRV